MKPILGRGIESLIPKKTKTIEKENKKETVFYVDLGKISSNPFQPRKEFDQNGLKSLSESIMDYGVLQPLIVSRINKETGSQYQLIAGERRFLASKMAGLSEVPVIIRQAEDREKLELSLIENVQRMDLNPLEKAEAYQRLHDEFGLLQKDVARVCGVSREAVANSMRILDLPNEIKQGLRDQKISEGHARAMLGVKDPGKQKAVFLKTIKDGLNVREVEVLAQKIEIWQPTSRNISESLAEEIKKMEEKLRSVLSVKNLKIRVEGGKPKLTLFFKDKKEVEDLLNRIKSS